MRKQNSTFRTVFLSEAGGEPVNNDYFAYVELDKYACYVIADGLNEQPDAESARLAIETILLAFQDHPSIGKKALKSYLRAGDRALRKADGKNSLKASVTVLVSDYVKIRYGYAGNTRMRLYRDGNIKERTEDMSLGNDMAKEKKQTSDILSRHEERNNLYTWLGCGKGFRPYISKKTALVNGDILTLYTRGIWENLDEGELKDVFSEAKDDPQECIDNVEDMLLSKQPADLGNYTFVTIFVDKVFTDPNRKRRIRKIILVSVIVLVIIVVIALVIWLLRRQRARRTDEMERSLANTMEYMKDGNYVRAGEECEEALESAEKLRDKEMIEDISSYLMLIEAVNKADSLYGEQEYESAQEDYMTAMERSRSADHVADEYIEKKLSAINDYLSVYDYIRMGDSLSVKGDYKAAEEKYLLAKNLATGICFDGGRKDAMDSLDRIYEEMAKETEEEEAGRKELAAAQAGAAELLAEGDKAFSDGDYEGAKVYYAMALDKYQKLEDDGNSALAGIRLQSCVKKAEEKAGKEAMAEQYIEEAAALEEEGDLAGAKKKYLLAKDIYKELKEEDKASRTENRMDMLDVVAEEEREKRQQEEQQQYRQQQEQGGESVSGNMLE